MCCLFVLYVLVILFSDSSLIPLAAVSAQLLSAKQQLFVQVNESQ